MKQSAGILVYRKGSSGVEVLLGHPGGPFYAKKDAWSIPKGELEDGEDHLTAAYREYFEETAIKLDKENLIELGQAKQGSVKINYIWAKGADPDLNQFACHSLFELEWPPKSGKKQRFPEIDKIRWFDLPTAKQKLFKDLKVFIDRLADELNVEIPTEPDQQSLI